MPVEPTLETLSSPAVRYVVATRPGFLTAAVVPVLIGLGVASRYAPLEWGLALLTLVGAVMAHAGANVLNDAYDVEGDAINGDHLFPFSGGSRIIQNGVLSRGTVASFGWLLLVLTTLLGLVLTVYSGTGLLLIGLLGLFLGWAYSAPPFRLCAHGLGEPTVAVAFGLLIPAGACYVQLGYLPDTLFWAGLPYAFLIALVLYINQFPDVAADAAVGKRNWVVRLTPGPARYGYVALAALAYLALVGAVTLGSLPVYLLAGLATGALHAKAAMVVWRHADNPQALRPAVSATLGGALGHGLLVAALLAWL